MAVILVLIPTVVIGQNNPEFRYLSVTGKERNIREYYGKTLVIDASTSWCPSCETQLKELAIVKNEVGDAINILSISIDNERDNVEKYGAVKEKTGVQWEFGLDKWGEFQAIYNVRTLPTLLIFEEDGVLKKRFDGLTSASEIVEVILPDEQGVTESRSQLEELILNSNTLSLTLMGFILILYLRPKKRPEIDTTKRP